MFVRVLTRFLEGENKQKKINFIFRPKVRESKRILTCTQQLFLEFDIPRQTSWNAVKNWELGALKGRQKEVFDL